MAHIKTMPAADNEDSGQFTSALISSMHRTMRNILELADASGKQCFDVLIGLMGGKPRCTKPCTAQSAAVRPTLLSYDTDH